MAASTAPFSPEITSAVEKLLKNQQIPFKIACETLFKVLGNIINSPDEEKYRELRCDSTTFTSKIACAAGGKAFLRAVGFVQAEGSMQLPAPPDMLALKQGRLALKDVVRRQATAAQELQERENAEAAQKLKELQEATRKRRANIDAETAAYRDSLVKGLQIDRNEFERQRDPTNLH